jgi:hypothetical protein
VTKVLFARWPDTRALARADVAQLMQVSCRTLRQPRNPGKKRRPSLATRENQQLALEPITLSRPSRLSTTYVADLCGRRVSGRLGAAFWATLRFYHFAVPAQIGRLTSGVSRCAFAPF